LDRVIHPEGVLLMPSAAQASTRHRTLWISDVHLGSPGSKARQLTEFLRRNDCDRLYLVGDIFDGWKLSSRFYWTTAHTRAIQAVITMARRGTRVYYLTGNHDGFMRKFVRSQIPLGRVRVANEVVHTTADGRRLLVIHGDVFDDVVNGLPWLAHAGDLAYELLMRSNRSVNAVRRRIGLPYWSLSAFAKTRVKSLVQELSGFDDKVLLDCKRRRLNGVICGHTHHAEIRALPHGVTVYNCGDWVESCTALAEDAEGRMQILRYDTQTRAVSMTKPVSDQDKVSEAPARKKKPRRKAPDRWIVPDKPVRLPLAAADRPSRPRNGNLPGVRVPVPPAVGAGLPGP
jgi:UDP-2,3-diacylglucosamine pyrophosphatase LpxH